MSRLSRLTSDPEVCHGKPTVRGLRYPVAAGRDAVHTSGLPDGNRTKDGALVTLADGEDRVLATKDGDAAAGLREGLAETLSVNRLGV